MSCKTNTVLSIPPFFLHYTENEREILWGLFSSPRIPWWNMPNFGWLLVFSIVLKKVENISLEFLIWDCAAGIDLVPASLLLRGRISWSVKCKHRSGGSPLSLALSLSRSLFLSPLSVPASWFLTNFFQVLTCNCYHKTKEELPQA